MLKLTKKADYGLIALGHLARQYAPGACSAREIAKTYGIPPELLAKILQRLVKMGLLVSQHGSGGGYALARPASEVTAFDVVRALDGPLFITSCVTARGNCLQAPRCTVREPLSKLNEIIAKALSSVTLANLDQGGSDFVQIRDVPPG